MKNCCINIKFHINLILFKSADNSNGSDLSILYGGQYKN